MSAMWDNENTWRVRRRIEWPSWNIKYEDNTNTVEDAYDKLDSKHCRYALGNMVMGHMTVNELRDVLGRIANKPDGKVARIADIHKARLILTHPEFEEVFPFDELESNIQLGLVFRDFDRFIGEIDVNLLSRKDVRLFIDARHDKFSKYLAKNMLPERMSEIFTMDMWEHMIVRYPWLAKHLDIKRVRNQTELRRFIMKKPHILRWSTLDDMKDCVIDGPTWVRIVTKLPIDKRKHVPKGFVQWAERDIFTSALKGRRFKKFDKTWKEGLESD